MFLTKCFLPQPILLACHHFCRTTTCTLNNPKCSHLCCSTSAVIADPGVIRKSPSSNRPEYSLGTACLLTELNPSLLQADVVPVGYSRSVTKQPKHLDIQQIVQNLCQTSVVRCSIHVMNVKFSFTFISFKLCQLAVPRAL